MFLPSSFLSLGSLLVASSTQFPSSECFSSRGFPTNTRSTSSGRSASFRNSPIKIHSTNILLHIDTRPQHTQTRTMRRGVLLAIWLNFSLFTLCHPFTSNIYSILIKVWENSLIQYSQCSPHSFTRLLDMYKTCSFFITWIPLSFSMRL